MSLQVQICEFDAAELVRAVDENLAVETASAQQRRIEDFRPIGRGDQHEAAARIEAVQFN